MLISRIIDIIFLGFTVPLGKFNLPQVKWNLMSSIIIFVYDLSHELPNNSRPGILGNYGVGKKSQNVVNIGYCPASYIKIKF